jgi:hypothetical protein
MRTTHDAGDKTIGQWMALAIGLAFVVAGIAGFFVTGFDDFTGNTDKTLLGLEVNGLHNLVHLGLGALGLAMWRTPMGARNYGWITFLGYGLVTLYGFITVPDEPVLSLNSADNVFHLVTALAGLATAMLATRRADAPDYGRTARGHA